MEIVFGILLVIVGTLLAIFNRSIGAWFEVNDPYLGFSIFNSRERSLGIGVLAIAFGGFLILNSLYK
jgi:hypothetical protein